MRPKEQTAHLYTPEEGLLGLTSQECNKVLFTDGQPKPNKYDVNRTQLLANTVRIGFTNARLFRYTLKFEPGSEGFEFTKKEKTMLASRFLEELGISDLDEKYVFSSKFELFSPSSDIDLETRGLRTLLTRRTQWKDGAFKSFLKRGSEVQKIWTKLECADLVDRGSKNLCAGSSYDGTEEDAQVVCFVYADFDDSDASLIFRTTSESRDPKRFKEPATNEIKILVRMLDAALKRKAVIAHERFMRNPNLDPEAVVHGNRIFDFKTQAVRLEENNWLELRKGVAVETRCLEDRVIRQTTPTVQVFFKDNNLADMVEEILLTPDIVFSRRELQQGLSESDKKTRGRKELKKFLIGLKICTFYQYPQRITRITGVGMGSPSETYFELGHAGQITVEEYFAKEKGYKALKYPDQPCVVVGSLDRPQYLPTSMCFVLPGQSYTRIRSPSLQADVDKHSREYFQSFPYISEKDLLMELMQLSTSPKTIYSFNFTIEHPAESVPVDPENSFISRKRLNCNRLTKRIEIPSSWKSESDLTARVVIIGWNTQYTRTITGYFRAEFASGHVTLKGENDQYLPRDSSAAEAKLKEFLEHEDTKTVLLALWVDKKRLPDHNRKLKEYCDKTGRHMVSVAVENPLELTHKDKDNVIDALRKAKTKIWSSSDLPNTSSSTLLVGIHIARVPTSTLSQNQNPQSQNTQNQNTQTLSNGVVHHPQRRGPSKPPTPKGLRGPSKVKKEENKPKKSCFVISVVSKWAGVEGFYRATIHHEIGSENVWQGFDVGKHLEEHLKRRGGLTVGNDKRVVIYRSGIRPQSPKKSHGISGDVFAAERLKLKSFKDERDTQQIFYITVDQSSKIRLGNIREGKFVNGTLTERPEGAEEPCKDGSKSTYHIRYPEGLDHRQDDPKTRSSVIACPGLIHMEAGSWLMQKDFFNSGTAQPLVLTLIDDPDKQSLIKNQLQTAFEASWDYPPGISSSKMVAPVHFARLAARRALVYCSRATLSDNNMPMFDGPEPDGFVSDKVKDTLYYI